MKTAPRVVGESKIFHCKKEQDCRIRRVRLLPEHPKALPEAVAAIRRGGHDRAGRRGACIPASSPTCWWTASWRPSGDSDALKIYVCNVMTQDGETEGYTASRPYPGPVSPLAAAELLDLCLVQLTPPCRHGTAGAYTREGAEPHRCATGTRCEALGVEVVQRAPWPRWTNGLRPPSIRAIWPGS